MDTWRDKLAGEIDDLLREILTSYLRPPTPPAGEMNITLGQMECLHTISQLGRPTMSEVAAAMHLHPSTVTVLVDGLVAHGLVERLNDPHDRRIIRVSETAQGARNHRKHMNEMRSRVTDLLSGLSDEELERMHTSLSTLWAVARLQAEAGKAAAGSGLRKGKKTP